MPAGYSMKSRKIKANTTSLINKIMKKIQVLFCAMLIGFGLTVQGQNVAVNANGNQADPSALLDVASTTRGMLVPRMTTLQRSAIANPAIGLLVYDLNTSSFWYYEGTAWTEIINDANQDNMGNHTASQDVEMQTNALLFTDAENGNSDVIFTGSDASTPDEGVSLRALSNPASGEPILRVMSSGASERLRVEHDGKLSTTNTLEVLGTGSSSVAGNLGVGLVTPTEALDVDGQIRVRGGTPGIGKVLTDTDGNGTAEWVDPAANIGVTRTTGTIAFVTNNNWEGVSNTVSLAVRTGDVLTLDAISYVRLIAGVGADEFDCRISITGCHTGNTNVQSFRPAEDVANHDNFNPFPYLNYFTSTCDGTLSFTLQVRNSGNDPWQIRDRVLIVKKY